MKSSCIQFFIPYDTKTFHKGMKQFNAKLLKNKPPKKYRDRAFTLYARIIHADPSLVILSDRIHQFFCTLTDLKCFKDAHKQCVKLEVIKQQVSPAHMEGLVFIIEWSPRHPVINSASKHEG